MAQTRKRATKGSAGARHGEPREPSTDEIAWLATRVLRYAVALHEDHRRNKGGKKKNTPTVEGAFLAHLVDAARNLEANQRINVSGDISITHRDIKLVRLRDGLTSLIEYERKLGKKLSPAARTQQRLHRFELFGLLNEAQRKVVETFSASEYGPSTAAAMLISKVYGIVDASRGVRVQDETKSFRSKLFPKFRFPDGALVPDEIAYDVLPPSDTGMLRYVVDEVLFGSEIAADAVVSAWEAAHDPDQLQSLHTSGSPPAGTTEPEDE